MVFGRSQRQETGFVIAGYVLAKEQRGLTSDYKRFPLPLTFFLPFVIVFSFFMGLGLPSDVGMKKKEKALPTSDPKPTL